MSSGKERVSKNEPEKSEDGSDDLNLSASESTSMTSGYSSDDMLSMPSSMVSSFEKTANERTAMAAPVSAITGLLFTVVAFLSLVTSYVWNIDWVFVAGGIVVVLGITMIVNASRRKS